MERISYSPETLFHVLTHFETADEALRDSLRRAGFTDEAIGRPATHARVQIPPHFRPFSAGSRRAAATGFPRIFHRPAPRSRRPGAPVVPLRRTVGTSGLAADAELTPAERATVRNILRNGCPVRTVRTSRTISTGACQLILERTGEAGYALRTLFPGELAPPLPCRRSPRSFLGDASPHRIQLNPAATGGGMRTGSEPVFQTMRDRCRAS